MFTDSLPEHAASILKPFSSGVPPSVVGTAEATKEIQKESNGTIFSPTNRNIFIRVQVSPNSCSSTAVIDPSKGGSLFLRFISAISKVFSRSIFLSNISIVGCVIAMGKDSYRDKKKFPTGPWCQIGDWVIFRAYSGTKMKLSGGQEIRLINDDTVEGIIADPRRVVRA